MPLLHGQLDIAQLDFAKIEKQFNTIQMDMVKLATLVLGNKDASKRLKSVYFNFRFHIKKATFSVAFSIWKSALIRARDS